MKTKITSHPKKALERRFKQAWIALAAAVGLTWAGSAQAQNVTGTLILSNIPPTMTAVYGDWTTATITDTTNGFEVFASEGADDGGGSGYYQIAAGDVQILNTNDAQAVMTITINDGNTESTMWVGMPIILGDNVGNYEIGGYVGEFANGYNGTQSPGSATFVTNANNTMTITITMNLPAAMISTIKAGGDSVNGLNLLYYPALYDTDEYDITYNSLVLQPAPPVPVVKITSSQYNLAAGQSTLIWTSQASAQYTVQYSTNLLSGFTPLTSNIASGGATTTNTVTVPAGGAGFFRIMQQ
jgi:hypothetical protein